MPSMISFGRLKACTPLNVRDVEVGLYTYPLGLNFHECSIYDFVVSIQTPSFSPLLSSSDPSYTVSIPTSVCLKVLYFLLVSLLEGSLYLCLSPLGVRSGLPSVSVRSDVSVRIGRTYSVRSVREGPVSGDLGRLLSDTRYQVVPLPRCPGTLPPLLPSPLV